MGFIRAFRQNIVRSIAFVPESGVSVIQQHLMNISTVSGALAGRVDVILLIWAWRFIFLGGYLLRGLPLPAVVRATIERRLDERATGQTTAGPTTRPVQPATSGPIGQSGEHCPSAPALAAGVPFVPPPPIAIRPRPTPDGGPASAAPHASIWPSGGRCGSCSCGRTAGGGRGRRGCRC